MNFDRELQRAIENLPAMEPQARLNDLRIIHMLRDTRALQRTLGTKMAKDPRVATQDTTFPGPGGRELAARIYSPAGSGEETAGTLRAGLVFFHGGGYVMGDVYTEEERCLALCAPGGVVVVSLAYGLAPEEPHPAASEDGYAGLCWVADNAERFGIDTTRVAVGGSSAGGGLAAAVALMARDRGGPPLAFQLLVYPMLDDRLKTPSMTDGADYPLFNRRAAEDAWGHFLGGREADSYAAPARASDVAGLPPAYVMVAEHDPLRDEGIDYARRLVEAGVPTELHLVPGTFHGFDIVGLHTEVGRRAVDEQVRALQRTLRRTAVQNDAVSR